MPALIHPTWPKLSRRLLVTAGVFFAAFVVVTVMVKVGAFGAFNLRLTHSLQARGSQGQDIALGLFAYLGSIEVTLVVGILLGVALFRGLRLLAVLPAAVILFASGLEYLGKKLIVSPGPGHALDRFPGFLPTFSHNIAPYSYPSGHMLRTMVTYGLVLYLAERWELFGRDSSRLSPVLVLLIALMSYAVIYLGWHWFSDALGGLLLGLTLLFALIAYLERKRTVNPGHAPVED
ncbi:MAG TPA: phosphatase PAP2 family protein [Candidatus Dormibacteraeota bacterium]|nr:phosphatase PAP2 family protein [Candidatus Dormibacteraeota bacterium]